MMDLLNSLRAELLKLARQSLAWGLAAIVIAITLGRGLLAPPDPTVAWTGLWGGGLMLGVAVVLAAATAGQEMAEGTWRALAARGVARWRLAAAPWLAVVLVCGVLLAGLEVLAVLVGVRAVLRWDELVRAWLCLWPAITLAMLLAVLARNAGLSLLVGVMLAGLEQMACIMLGGLAMLGETDGWWRVFGPYGLGGSIYRWSLTYNSTMWTYLADLKRMPSPNHLLAMALPRLPATAALVLAAYTVLAAGLAMLIVYRRDMVEVTAGPSRRVRQAGRAGRAPARHLAGTGRGPVVFRLAYAHVRVLSHTSLVKISAIVGLLFLLALWAMASALPDPGFLFRRQPGAGSPLALAATLLLLGPLAAVISILSVANDVGYGTRRAQLVRGVTRLQAAAGQSLALLAVLAVLAAGLLVAALAVSGWVSGELSVSGALVTLGAGLLLAGTYLGVAQVGAALGRSSLGPMVAGLGLLVADWATIIAASMDVAEPGRLGLTPLAFGLATGRPLVDFPGAALPLPPWAALALLGVAAIGSHALALVIAYRRDA